MRRGHAADDVRAGDGHAVADVEEGVVVGAAQVALERELLARRHQEGALVAVVEHVAVGDQRLVAVEALRRGSAGPRRGSPPSISRRLRRCRWAASPPSCRAWERPRRGRRTRPRSGLRQSRSGRFGVASAAPRSLAGNVSAQGRIPWQSRITPVAALWRCHHVHKKAGEYALKDRNSPARPRCERQARCQAWVQRQPRRRMTAQSRARIMVFLDGPFWRGSSYMNAPTSTTYRVEAYNLSHASENKIHDDAVAQKLGFAGGLVPGVEVYAYACHPAVAALGPRLAGARAHGVPLPEARLRRPHRRGHGAGRQRRPRPRGAERGRALRHRPCVAGGRLGEAAVDRYLSAAHPAARSSAGQPVEPRRGHLARAPRRCR